jgi:hypothetical protein
MTDQITVNGWQQLRAQALESGHVLSPQYMLWVLKNQVRRRSYHGACITLRVIRIVLCTTQTLSTSNPR